MKSSEGVVGIEPQIKKISFEQKGKIYLHLKDGRIIITPLKLFPSISKLSTSQRKKYTISDGEIIVFHHSDEVYHIEQFLGREKDYQYSFR